MEALREPMSDGSAFTSVTVSGLVQDLLPFGKGFAPLGEVVIAAAARNRTVLTFRACEGLRTEDAGLRQRIQQTRSGPEAGTAEDRVAQMRERLEGRLRQEMQFDALTSYQVLAGVLASPGRVAAVLDDPDTGGNPLLADYLRSWVASGTGIAQGNLLVVIIRDMDRFQRQVGKFGMACLAIEITQPSQEDVRSCLELARAAEPSLFEAGGVDILAERFGSRPLADLDYALRRIRKDGVRVTPAAMAAVLDGCDGVPDTGRILKAEAAARREIVGAEPAIDFLVGCAAMAATGMRPRRGVLGCMLLAGPSGCGKSMVPRVLMELLRGPKGVLQFSLEKCRNEANITELFGPPPGFRGFGETRGLLGQVDGTLQVLILDEAEKCVREILESLLTALESGLARLGDGTEVNLRNLIVVFTTNLGCDLAERIQDAPGRRAAYMDVLEAGFGRPFLNRMQAVMSLDALSADGHRRVVEQAVQDGVRRVEAGTGNRLRITPAAMDALVRAAERRGQAGHTANHAVTCELLHKVARFSVREQPGRGSPLVVDADAQGTVTVGRG